MAITLGTTGILSVVGPGCKMVASGLVLPVATGDYLEVFVQNSSNTGIVALASSVATKGAGTVPFYLGQQDVNLGTNPALAPVPAATAVQFLLFQFHANGSVADGPYTYTGFTWDPIANFSQLFATLSFGLGNTALAQILAAVTATYPFTP